MRADVERIPSAERQRPARALHPCHNRGMRVIAALGAVAVALLCATEVEADGRTTLVLRDADGGRTVLAVTMSQGICETIASRLNFYAALPPADADLFYCRSPY